MMKTPIVLTATALALSLAITACITPTRAVVVRPTGEIVVSETPPPTGRTEAIPPSPGAADVWVPGFWGYHDNQWVWVPGYWQAPPRTGAVWVPGHWDSVTGGWSWTPGHWE
ncbi:MAG TPA: YXWGXW repeat-containing protein [Verrucomicrobiae bacterium]|nr:YXWGXW repeat-containing protein [Verrucomicrobiae bacterium]